MLWVLFKLMDKKNNRNFTLKKISLTGPMNAIHQTHTVDIGKAIRFLNSFGAMEFFKV